MSVITHQFSSPSTSPSQSFTTSPSSSSSAYVDQADSISHWKCSKPFIFALLLNQTTVFPFPSSISLQILGFHSSINGSSKSNINCRQRSQKRRNPREEARNKGKIGRIVRGNNFTIKDDGISSNHLLIEVHDSSWVLSDLNTSNGTFLNGVQIEPNSPTTLKDGDFIKIGEFTSIKVSFGEQTKKVVGKTKGLKSSGSGAVEVEVVGGGVPVRRYPRRGAAVVSKEQVVECTDVVSEVVTRGRRGRGRKNAALENETVEIVAEVNIGDDSKSAAEVVVSESLEVISGSNSKGKEVAESPEVEVGDSSIGNNSKEKEVVESPKVEVGDSSIGNNSKGKEVVESRKVRVGDSSKWNNSKGKEVAESPKVGDSSKGNHVACDDIPEKSTNEEKMTLEKLNKMTLGEWFDYLEVYLVKQINKETDEIIDGMRAKAEEFKKFMSEQQKLKKKSPLAS